MIADDSRTSLLGGILMLLSCASLVGCGGPPDGMLEVSGTVTWNGQPIETGVTGIPLRSELPCKLLKYSTIGIEPPDFCFYSMGLKR